MAVDSISPVHDPRIKKCKAYVNGRTYQYLQGLPQGTPKATIFLIHGFPDLSMGWRFQIPMLLQMGLRVVCPDLMGYGGTDAPRVPPEPISYYGFRKAATDIKELAQQLGSSTVILGGHDWGGAIVYRVALWYPELVTHLFSVCTPYRPPSKTFVPLEELVKTKLPNFTYQLQFGGKSVEEAVVSRQQIREFLNLAYGGRGPNGEVGFTSREGVRLDMLSKANDTVLVSKEILEYYADQYARNGMHGPLNWYRNREINFQEELALDKSTIDIPVLFIQAKKDAALPPEMSVGMEKSIPNLSKEEVDTQHWALWEAPEQVNGMIKNWLENKVLGTRSNL